MPLSPEKAESAVWFVDDTLLYHVIPIWGSHLEVTEYYAVSGQMTRSSTAKIQAAWISEQSCALVAPYFSCAINDQIISIDLSSDNGEITTKPLDRESQESPRIVKGSEPALLHGNTLYQLNADRKISIGSPDALYIQNKLANDEIVLLGSVDRTEHVSQCGSLLITTNKKYSILGSKTIWIVLEQWQ
jgi:hypothetical protein